MDSKIIMGEVVDNKERRFGSWKEYYPCKVLKSNGEEKNALFTQDQIEQAIDRAERNPEDIPEDQTFWDWLFG